MSDESSATSYRAIVQDSSGDIIGSVTGNPASEVNLFITFKYDEKLRACINIRANVAAPPHIHSRKTRAEEVGRFTAELDMINVNVANATIKKLSNFDLPSVSPAVLAVHDFDRINSDDGIYEMKFQYIRKGMTSKGLFNQLNFDNYRGPNGSFVSKPHVQETINTFRRFFENDNSFTIYIRQEGEAIDDAFNAIMTRFKDDTDEGPMIRKFHPAKYHKDGSGIPPLQYGQLLSPDERPSNTHGLVTNPVNTYTDIVDFSTRMAFGIIELEEHAQKQVSLFNNSLHSIKLLSVPNMPNYFIAEFEQDRTNSDMQIQLKAKDVVHIRFGTSTYTNAPEWRGDVLTSPPWMKSGVVAIRLTVPKMSEESCEIEASDTNRPRIPVPFSYGNGNQLNDDATLEAFEKAVVHTVMARLEHTEIPVKRQIVSLNSLAQGQKQDPTTPAGQPNRFKDNEHLQKLRKRVLNQTSIPEGAIDLIGGATSLLTELTDLDHCKVISYLQKVPVIDGLGLGVITGRAGSGKTQLLATIMAATLASNQSKPEADREDLRFLYMAPSNEPTDVGMAKIFKACQKHDILKGEYIIRGYNVKTESNYVHAYARLQTKSANDAATLSASSAKPEPATSTIAVEPTTPIAPAVVPFVAQLKMLQGQVESEHFYALQKLIKMNDIDVSKAKAEPFFENDILKNYSSEIINNVIKIFETVKMERKSKDNTSTAAAEVIIPVATDDDNEILANLDMDDVNYANSVYVLTKNSLDPGASLVRDSRFIQVRQSIGYAILETCGIITPGNKYTDAEKWSRLRGLIERSIEEGGLNQVDNIKLTEELTSMRAFILTHALVVGTTPINACSAPYYTTFKPTVLVGDETNRGTIPEFISAWCNFEAHTALLVGDPKQLAPVISGPKVPAGFQNEIGFSVMRYFQSTHLHQAEIFTQRRARAGAHDIPTEMFYKKDIINGPLANCDETHPITKPGLAVVNSVLPPPGDDQLADHPEVYIAICGSKSIRDPVSSSIYNLDFASLTLHLVQHFSDSGINGASIGIVTPYSAQIRIYQYALRQLHIQNKYAGYDKVIVGTIDSMEGNEASIVVFDSGVTDFLGFTNDGGRLLVALTRATDLTIVVGQPGTLQEKHSKPGLLRRLYNRAGEKGSENTNGLIRELEADHPFYTHPHVKFRAHTSTIKSSTAGNSNGFGSGFGDQMNSNDDVPAATKKVPGSSWGEKTNGDSPGWTNAPVPSPADLANAAAAWSDFETQVTTPTISSSMEIDLEDSTRKRQAQPDLTNPSKSVTDDPAFEHGTNPTTLDAPEVTDSDTDGW